MLHIKLKGMENRAPRKHIFCPYTHLRLKDQTMFTLKVVISHIKLKGMEHRAPCKTNSAVTHTQRKKRGNMGLKGQNIFF